MVKIIIVLSIFCTFSGYSQTDLPYQEIPEYPASYSATSVVARMIDGLGFRYHWATDGLREEDLAYRFSESSRTALETLYHVYGLAEVIYSSVHQQPSVRPLPELSMTLDEMRVETLRMLKEASDLLKVMDDQKMKELSITFQRGEKESTFPFWHQLNGPLADALWHVGQVVSSRRASGNPIDFGVNVFMGNRRNQ